MEYVEGTTLRAWIEQRRPAWPAILELLLQAGDGLAAAHRHGLVHRDFKPDNVLVTPQGVQGESGARVVDFGLASIVDELDASVADSRDDAHTPVSPTRPSTGGTPRYMAPELLEHRGDPRPAHDQYAFCVTAFECFCGAPPFGGTTVAQHLVAKHSPPLRNAELAALPRWLVQPIVRGLDPDPAMRPESLPALLATLRDGRTRARRRRWALGIGTAMIAATIAGVSWGSALRPDPPAPCDGIAAQAHALWSEASRTALRDDIAAKSGDDQLGGLVVAQIDGWVERWSAARHDACEDTLVAHAQSDDTLELRVACLDRGLVELGALLDALADADEATAHASVSAAARLPALEACNDVDSLRALARLPRDPALAEEVRAIERELATNRTLSLLGRYAELGERCTQLIARASATEHAPTIAAALQQRGRLRSRLGELAPSADDFEQALLAAERGGDDRRKVELYADLAAVVTKLAEDYPRAEAALRNADATLERLADPWDLVADVAEVEGLVLAGKNDLDGARLAFERAWRFAVLSRGEQHPLNTAIAANLAAIDFMRGDLPAALAQSEHALASARATYGAAHPEIAMLLGHRAAVKMRMGDFAAGLADSREAVELLVRSLGERHVDVAVARMNLASSLTDNGQADEAIRELNTALAILAESLPADHAQLVMAHWELARAYSHAKRWDQSLAEFGDALAIAERRKDDDDILMSLRGLASVERKMGKLPAARDHWRRCLVVAAQAKMQPDTIAEAGIAWTELALQLGDREDAGTALARTRASLADRTPSAMQAASLQTLDALLAAHR
jgi:tetratricopeptide (TPR) repeat protein